MSPEVLLLALSTVIRPTTVAALFAILAQSHPHRLLVAYIVGGLAFSLTVGVAVVVLLRGLAVRHVSPFLGAATPALVSHALYLADLTAFVSRNYRLHSRGLVDHSLSPPC